MTLGELKKSILAGEVKPFYRLTGSDEFIKNMAVERIKTVVTDFQDMNVTVLSSPDPKEATDLMDTVPFCADYRVVVLEDVSDWSQYLGYFKNPSPSTVTVIREAPQGSSKKGKKSDSPAKIEAAEFVASVTSVECEPLEGSMMISFLAREAASYGAEITEEAAKLLAEYCKSDMFRLKSETGKLASVRVGSVIESDDVKELVKPDVEYSVWALSDEITKGNTRESVKMFSSLDDGRTDSRTLLFGAIYSNFRKLYYASVTPSDELLMSVLSMKPYAVSRARAQARKTGSEPLRRIMEFLADFDYRSKNGLVPAEAYGEYLVIGIINALKGGKR